jgi:hypothetical protein
MTDLKVYAPFMEMENSNITTRRNKDLHFNVKLTVELTSLDFFHGCVFENRLLRKIPGQEEGSHPLPSFISVNKSRRMRWVG